MLAPVSEDGESKEGKPTLLNMRHVRSSEKSEDDNAWLGTGVVANADAMKAQVKNNLLRPRYNVTDFYHMEGAFQAVARSAMFENITLVVIALNALWIAIDTDWNEAEVLIEADPIFQIVDHMFCIFFTFELFVRFMSFRRKCDCRRDAWFLFDCCLVGMMVAETWVITAVMLATGQTHNGNFANPYILRVARLLRLSRMARVVRLLRVMPELLILIKGMVAAMRSVFFTLCLLIVLLYVFGIALKQLAEGTEAGELYFASVAESMYTLLIRCTFLEFLGVLVEEVGKESTICVICIWVFVLLAPLTVLNMLIGVLCEVVSAVAAIEKEAIVVSFTKDKMWKLFADLDESGDGLISREEFLGLLQKPETARLLTDVGVDVSSLIDEADAIFTEDVVNEDGEQEERQLTFMDLMEVVLELRGSNHVSVKHMVQLRKYVLAAIAQTNKNLTRLEGVILNPEGEPRRKGGRMKTRIAPSMSMTSITSGESSRDGSSEKKDADNRRYDSREGPPSAEAPVSPTNDEASGRAEAQGPRRADLEAQEPGPPAVEAKAVEPPPPARVAAELEQSEAKASLRADAAPRGARPVSLELVRELWPMTQALEASNWEAQDDCSSSDGEDEEEDAEPGFGGNGSARRRPAPAAAPSSRSFGPNPNPPVDPQWRGARPRALPPVPAGLPGADLKSLVRRLEDIIMEARAEIQRELGRGQAAAAQPAAGHVRAARVDKVTPPSRGQQAAGLLNTREWWELRAKLAGITGTVAGVAELRRLHAQLDEEEPGKLLDPPWCRFTSDGSAAASL